MRAKFFIRGLLASIAIAIAAVAPVQADQILGVPRIDNSSKIQLPGGPTLGRWQSGKYTSTPDALSIQGDGSLGNISTMSAQALGGFAPRMLSDIFADRVNVKDFSAKGDASADDTDAFNRAIAKANTIVANGYGQRRAVVVVPAGHYLVKGLDLPPNVGLVSDGSKNVFITLKAGSNRSVIRILPYGLGDGDSTSQTYAYSTISGLLINGQSSQQTGTSYCIEFPDNTSGVYNGSGKLNDVVGLGCLSGGIYVGTARNWMVGHNITMTLNGGSPYIINGFDHRFSALDGAGQESVDAPVLDIRSGGNIVFEGSNFYIGGKTGAATGRPTVKISQYVTGFVDFLSPQLDYSRGPVIEITRPDNGVPRPIRLFGGLVDKTNRDNAGHPYVRLIGTDLQVDYDFQSFGTTFDRQGDPNVAGSYVVKADIPTTKIVLQNPLIPTGAVSTAVTNAIIADTPRSEFRAGSNQATLAYSNTSAATNFFGTAGLGFNIERLPNGSWQVLADGNGNAGGALIDGKIDGTLRFYSVPLTSTGNKTYTDAQMISFLRMQVFANGNVQFFNTPSASTGLSSGMIWRDPSAGNVLKMVP